MANSLTDLLKKKGSFKWKDEQQSAFNFLKGKLLLTLVLQFLDFAKLFEMHMDVSGFVIGAVLMQEGHLITFENKKLVGAELRWPIHEKELFVVMHYLKAWQHYLGFHKTKIFTNNVSLRYLETRPQAMEKQLRWHNTLAFMNIKLIHKHDKDNVMLNALSHKEEYQGEMFWESIQIL